MNNKIHATALVESSQIGSGVTVGPYAVIGRDVVIGDDVVIHPHVVIADGVSIGRGAEIFPGAFIGKEPKGAGALARQPEFDRRIEIGAGVSVGPHAIIYYDVTVGDQTLIGDGASIREKCRIGQKCIISRYVTINYNTVVGDGTKIMDNTHITGNCVIESGVFISAMVGTANDNAIGTQGYTDAVQGPVIRKGAAVGLGASLLPAVEVGSGAIVGAGAVVARDVPEGTLVMGMPARVVRRL